MIWVIALALVFGGLFWAYRRGQDKANLTREQANVKAAERIAKVDSARSKSELVDRLRDSRGKL